MKNEGQELNMSEEKFHVALRNVPIVIAHCDLDLRYTWIYNPHSDFHNVECIGKKDDELADNEGTLALKNLKKEVIETGEGLRREIKFPLTDSNRYYDVIAEPLRDKNGNIIGVTTASTDITEVKEMEQYIINLEKLHSISQLSYGVAHEFNNILAVIMALAQVTLYQMKQSEIVENKLLEKLNLIMEQCKKGEKISANLLNIIKPGNSKKKKIIIQNIIDDVLELQKNELILERISVIKKYNTNKHVLVDVSQMEQVFLNIVLNARHAIKPHNKGTIKVSVNEKNNFIKIVITDDGIGMDPEIQKRIFEPFFTTKGDCKKGSGLGLSMVLRIINNHNGQIHVNSWPGKGTKFIIELPAI